MAESAGEAVLGPVCSRLFQMGQLWEDAARVYFEPERFRLCLQTCITTSRTVTFILQSNKKHVPDFDAWYRPFQEAFKLDPVMTWSKNARNTIEKQGDLETYSQVRASIIASYMDGPETEWKTAALFASSLDILRSVPKKYLIPHVIENGTLLIERRWVENTLPEIEILEALAQVYSKLADLVSSLFVYLGAPMPDMLARRRLTSMAELAMDRAEYRSLKDASIRGHRYFKRAYEEPTDRQIKALKKRYGNLEKWDRISNAKSFEEVARLYFDQAKRVLFNDGYHQLIGFFLNGATVRRLVAREMEDRAAKYVVMREIAQLAKIDEADGFMMLGEAWIALTEDLPKSGFAAEARRRGEALVMHAVNSSGLTLSLQANYHRRAINKRKVKSVESTIEDKGSFEFILYPFMKVWNCVDEKRLNDALALQVELGLGEPKIDP